MTKKSNTQGISIVIPYVTSTVVWDELRYALRSIEKNCRFDFQVFLVAEQLPAWASEDLQLIKVKQVKGQPFSKAMDAITKLLAVLEDPRVTDDFIYTYDDTLFCNPLYQSKLKAFRKAHKALNSRQHVMDAFQSAGRNWKEGLAHAIDLLKKKNLPTFNYETHMPRFFNKEKIRATFNFFGLEPSPAIKAMAMSGFATLYYNLNYLSEPQILTHSDSFKGEIRKPLPEKNVADLFSSKLFINFTDQGLTAEVRKFIEKQFPKDSSLEKSFP